MLLIIFLFNVGGYYIIFWALRVNSNLEILSRVQKSQYNDDELITLKLPMALPYLTDGEGYRQATGEVEHHGEFYKLIKQKQEDDTLIVICIKNHKEKQLVEAMIDYANLSNDFPVESKNAQNLLSKLVKEYTPFAQKNIISTTGWTNLPVPNTTLFLSMNRFEPSVEAPPPKSCI